MSTSFFHARSSVRMWGGTETDYEHVHEWIDESKKTLGDIRHRALRHHTLGVWEAQQIFGVTITTSKGRQVAVREIAERHIIEDLGWLPTPADWLKELPISAWMGGRQRRSVRLATLNLENPNHD